MSVMMSVSLFPEKHLATVLAQPLRCSSSFELDLDGDDADEAGERRRFEFTEGSSEKFWEIVLEPDGFTVTFGKLGTAGQSRSKTFDDPDEAQQAAEAVIAEKLARGYREVENAPLEFRVETLQLEKTWCGLHYLLTGTAYEGKPPLDFLCNGGAEIEAYDVGHGAARALDAAAVKRIAAALLLVTPAALRKAFRPEAMNELDIYPADWTQEGEFETLEENFKALRALLKKGASKGHALLIAMA